MTEGANQEFQPKHEKGQKKCHEMPRAWATRSKFKHLDNEKAEKKLPRTRQSTRNRLLRRDKHQLVLTVTSWATWSPGVRNPE